MMVASGDCDEKECVVVDDVLAVVGCGASCYGGGNW